MAVPARPSFAGHVRSVAASGGLVVQPRMGFGDPQRMLHGLLATKHAAAHTAGTITLDSYTRVGDFAAVLEAIDNDVELNGYPIASIDPFVTLSMLDTVGHPRFPVQVRHGSALPTAVFDAMVGLGLDATEGGPASYCLPYSRVPLSRAVQEWAACCERFAELSEFGFEPHLESFGGCMLGQLCPPSLLVAITVLEGLFFRQHGVRSVSLSLTQQTHAGQDLEALAALHALAAEKLSDIDWHVVLYAYMGVYPRSPRGALSLLADATSLAVRGGAARLIVKTVAESYRIPTIAENVEALEFAAVRARQTTVGEPPEDTGVLAEARTFVDAVLELHSDVGKAIVRAFASGYLDVPYCLHADNTGRSRSYLDNTGRLRWSSVGAMPIRADGTAGPAAVSSSDLLTALSFIQRRYDEAASVRAGIGEPGKIESGSCR
ncbi:methylaspartate mutase [Lentzea sp. NBRC 105346]|uniref:methylaspartate mutase n=1 Tax=Lentzea sp. NBRC 105346 TaxID=3032205 RepID=UPI0024A1F04A|nr:methylaspartate mutase [Lentzea sp. NBRC 105346]GLZ29353.1 methylaspartate mutase [Lentzea sp. NBRC 105346]